MKTFLNLEKDQKRWILYFVALIVCFVHHWFSFGFLILSVIPCTNRTVYPPKKEACTMSSDGIQDL